MSYVRARWPLAELALTAWYLFLVIFAWGTNYPLMKLALRDMPPLTFSVVRLFGGAAVVAMLLWATGGSQLLPARRERLPLAGISILQYVSVLGLASISLQYLPAGRTVALIYSMPLWAAIFAAVILRARLSWPQCVGILVSIAGLSLFLNPSVIDWSEHGATLGLTLTSIAAVCWGLGAVLYRTQPWTASLLSQTLWQLIMAGCVLLPVALWMEYPISPNFTPALILILVWNWIVPTAIAVWAWTKLLSYLPGSLAGQFLMATPFVGIAASSWIFNEDLPAIFALSATMIAVGGGLTLLRKQAASPHGHSVVQTKD